jgi:hypothetical protein
MITSYDISERSPQDDDSNRIIIRQKIEQGPTEAGTEDIRVRHKVATTSDGLTSRVVVEAVDPNGNIIRAESFKLPVVTSRASLTSRLYAFEQSLIQDGYQVVAG